MSVLQSPRQSLQSSARRILVLGPAGAGKTTFSVSASQAAGDKIGSVQTLECSDVVLFSGDSEGVLGALDAGLSPRAVIDMTECGDWNAYKALAAKALGELRPLVAEGSVKFVIVDLSLPAKLIHDMVKPATIADWGRVATEGQTLYKAFGCLKGATIIANCQIKSALAAVETNQASAAADAKAVGGERNKFTADLPKGILSPWVENASFMFAREVKRRRPQGSLVSVRTFYTHTTANGTFEAKSRAHTVLKATEPGDRTLRSMLEAVYG